MSLPKAIEVTFIECYFSLNKLRLYQLFLNFYICCLLLSLKTMDCAKMSVHCTGAASTVSEQGIYRPCEQRGPLQSSLRTQVAHREGLFKAP